MRKASTLIEALVVVAILLTLVGLLWPAFSAASRRPDEPAQPPTTWRLDTVQHDGHRWVISSGGPAVFVHHPDCQCSGKAER
jgi:hypothetical protein